MEVDVDVEALVLELVLELVLDEVDVLVPPKLLLDVEVELPPVDVEVELPPVEVEVELPPVDVELPPVEVDVELPPVEVELPPVEVELPPVEVELPPVDVEVEPPDVEMVMVVLPPLELPPKKPPAKKPPPKPKPPELPPMTTGTAPAPELLATATGGGGGGGANMGGTIVRVVTVACWAGAGQATRRTVRRTTRRSAPARRTFVVLAFAWLTTAGRAGGFSATWTAPPPMIAPPQVQAQSFAKAILTDISSIPFLADRGWREVEDQYPSAGFAIVRRCKRSV